MDRADARELRLEFAVDPGGGSAGVVSVQTAGMVLIGGEIALAGWSNGRLGRLRAQCLPDKSVAQSEFLRLTA